MDWFFDGLGTMMIGLVIGGAAGCGITWKISNKNRNRTMKQKAGDGSTQTQVGGDQINRAD